jgi:hypothetical protein
LLETIVEKRGSFLVLLKKLKIFFYLHKIFDALSKVIKKINISIYPNIIRLALDQEESRNVFGDSLVDDLATWRDSPGPRN